MPQHANPGGNQDPNEEDNENVDLNQPNPPDDQQNPAPQPDLNQQQGNAGQNQPPQPQQQQAPDPDATQEAMNRLMGMLRQYPHYAQGLDPLTGRMIYPRLVPTPMRPLEVAQEHPLDYRLHHSSNHQVL